MSRCLSQELVQPGGVVTDLRTEVTGVSAADLEGVTATRDQVRAAVLDANPAPCSRRAPGERWLILRVI